MDQHRRARRVGDIAILCAVIIRLCTAGIPQRLARLLTQPRVQSFLIYLETGQYVRSSDSVEELPTQNPPVLPSTVPETEPEPETQPPLTFTEADLAQAAVTSTCGAKPELARLMEEPINLCLVSPEPTVLILHTHTTESYRNTDKAYEEYTAFRTLNEQYNMLSLGDRVAQRLAAKGITVLHDRQLHDYPSYNGAYSHARKALEAALEEHPSIQLVLDIHRDAAGDSGHQMRTGKTLNGEPTAQLMLVIGTGISGAGNAYWETNLSLALKLHVLMERRCAGLMRPINLRGQRFNQDLLPGTLLVEIGAAGDTHEEALRAADRLAEGILLLKDGSQ